MDQCVYIRVSKSRESSILSFSIHATNDSSQEKMVTVVPSYRYLCMRSTIADWAPSIKQSHSENPKTLFGRDFP